MKVTLESTKQRVVINTPDYAQIWRGRTESGIEIVAYIVVMAAEKHADKPALRAELERDE